jgi:hypothetical protein
MNLFIGKFDSRFLLHNAIFSPLFGRREKLSYDVTDMQLISYSLASPINISHKNNVLRGIELKK